MAPILLNIVWWPNTHIHTIVMLHYYLVSLNLSSRLLSLEGWAGCADLHGRRLIPDAACNIPISLLKLYNFNTISIGTQRPPHVVFASSWWRTKTVYSSIHKHTDGCCQFYIKGPQSTEGAATTLFIYFKVGHYLWDIIWIKKCE